MQKLDTDKIYETSDLYLAAYLKTRGLRLWAVDRSDPGRVVFCMTPRPDPQDVSDYIESRATVNVSEFGRALKKLKYRIYSD